ncbi:MAG: cell division protein FtsZ [Polaribacter sp.]|nr:MAG: cell division protein FtsZ [Polaribacter sp.]
MTQENNITFEMPKKEKINLIKVIGVGGGGGNAVNHMYEQKINGVDFVICNTDSQALEDSPISDQIQLGTDLLGTGAGGDPEKGAEAANESIEEIKEKLSGFTKMVFITAGMGGGTGTGAAPVIAKVAKDMGLLVVGIVTSPFTREGKGRLGRAKKGIEKLRENVDSLIVINNDKLRDYYGNLTISNSYLKADEVLTVAAKGIAEVITNKYKVNVDFQDAKTVLKNSGTAIMGAAIESGEDRAKKAITKALDSPLLNDNKIKGAKNVLLLVVSSKENEITVDEVDIIMEYIQEEAGTDPEIFLGYGIDDAMEDGVSVTVVATGFPTDQQEEIIEPESNRIIHTLEDEQRVNYTFEEKIIKKTPELEAPVSEKKDIPTIEGLGSEDIVGDEIKLIPTTEIIKNIDVVYHEIGGSIEDDFIITEVIKNKKVEPKQEGKKVVQPSLFDLPMQSIDEQQQIQNKAQQVDEQTNSNVEKRYVLNIEELEEIETPKVEVKEVSKVQVVEEIDKDLDFKIKVNSTIESQVDEVRMEESKEVSPLNCSIEELKQRSQQRRDTMKRFNHKFSSNLSNNIDELESLPAYKRQGINVDVTTSISKEETSLKKNFDEIELSSNSFLHDNVD